MTHTCSKTGNTDPCKEPTLDASFDSEVSHLLADRTETSETTQAQCTRFGPTEVSIRRKLLRSLSHLVLAIIIFLVGRRTADPAISPSSDFTGSAGPVDSTELSRNYSRILGTVIIQTVR